jgi:hypothetical protein
VFATGKSGTTNARICPWKHQRCVGDSIDLIDLISRATAFPGKENMQGREAARSAATSSVQEAEATNAPDKVKLGHLYLMCAVNIIKNEAICKYKENYAKEGGNFGVIEK